MDEPAELSSTEERLVWIMGSPRTGSTWLLRLLCHPWGVGRTETGIDAARWRPRGPDVVPVNESYLPHHLGPLRDPLPPLERLAESEPVLNGTRGDDPAYFFSPAHAGEWRPQLRAMALGRFAAQARLAADQHGVSEPLILIKEPNGSHAAGVVADLLPRSRMIFLLRDGRDVIDSMLAADAEGGWRTRTEGVAAVSSSVERLAAVRREAQLWLIRTLATERACARLGPARSIVVRYEELLSDTVGQLARLDEWLGLGRSETTLRIAVRRHRFGSLRNRLRGNRKGVRAASPGLWRENLSPEEQRLARTIIGAKLSELGYPE